jgi:hypothetical protein
MYVFYQPFNTSAMSKEKKTQQTAQVVRLSKEEQQQPIDVIACFFDCYHLKDFREMLWDWLLAALGTDSGIYDKGRERSNLIFFYQKMETLVEAAYLLQATEQKKEKKKK